MRKLFLSGVSTLALVAISSQGALAVETTAEAIIKASDSVKANDVWDEGSIRDNVIGGSSFKNSNGVLTVQQNNGNANRMLTAAGVNADTGALVKHISKASVQSKSAENIVVHFENPTAAYDRMNVIGGEAFTEGFARYMGILAVQQNNGDANDLGIATTVQGSVSDILGLEQTAETKGVTKGNSGGPSHAPMLNAGVRENLIENGAFHRAHGVLQIQENNGNQNVMSIATSVVGVNGTMDDAVQSAMVEGEIKKNPAVTSNALMNNSIIGAFNGEVGGIVTVQQNNADGNLMTAATAVLGNPAPDSSGSFDQTAGGMVTVMDGSAIDAESQRYNAIGSVTGAGSFNSVAGTITVQQNNGSHNGLAAANAVAGIVGDIGDVTQSAVLGASLNGSVTDDILSIRDNLVLGSFGFAVGLVNVQQNNGDVNAMGIANATLGGTGLGDAGNITQTAGHSDDSMIVGNSFAIYPDTWDDGSDRLNTLEKSFDHASGVATVQQNNGNVNVITAANAVASVMGGAEMIHQSAAAGGQIPDFGGWDYEPLYPRANDLFDSFGDASGAMTVQQNNGNGNIIDAATGVVATMGPSLSVAQHVTASGALAEFAILSASSDDGPNGGTPPPLTGNPRSWVTDAGSARENWIEESFKGARGQATVQQNNGDANVMAASTAVAVNGGDSGRTLDFAQAVSADGIVVYARTEALDEFFFGGVGSRDNLIKGSFGGGEGVMTVQQNTGSSNVMSAATGVAADMSGGSNGVPERVLDQSATATGIVEGNYQSLVDYRPTVPGVANLRDNTLRGSFKEGDGVVTVQQNNGDNNVLAAATAVVASLGGDDVDGVDAQSAYVGATVNDNLSIQDLGFVSDRTNDIHGSFNGANGVATVQQNNGNNNVLASAVAVVASLDATDRADGAIKHSGAGGKLKAKNNEVWVPGGAVSTNSVIDSFNSVSGVVSLIQNNGDANALGSSIAVTSHDLGLGQAMSLAELEGEVKGGLVTVGDLANGGAPLLRNEISGSFKNAHGAISVIQNNGNHNVIGSAITVSMGFTN